jgi:hypothetical protein
MLSAPRLRLRSLQPHAAPLPALLGGADGLRRLVRHQLLEHQSSHLRLLLGRHLPHARHLLRGGVLRR